MLADLCYIKYLPFITLPNIQRKYSRQYSLQNYIHLKSRAYREKKEEEDEPEEVEEVEENLPANQNLLTGVAVKAPENNCGSS